MSSETKMMTAEKPASAEALVAAPAQVRMEVEAFLYREARVLDAEQWREWLGAMVDKDIRYQVWSRQLRMRKDKRVVGPAEVYIYDDDYQVLDMRVQQFESGLQWRSDPPERLRHMVSNVEAFQGERQGEYLVYSNCLVTRNRRVYEESSFVYGREDVLRRDSEGRLRLLRRLIDYDQRFIEGRNLLFFL